MFIGIVFVNPKGDRNTSSNSVMTFWRRRNWLLGSKREYYCRIRDLFSISSKKVVEIHLAPRRDQKKCDVMDRSMPHSYFQQKYSSEKNLCVLNVN